VQVIVNNDNQNQTMPFTILVMLNLDWGNPHIWQNPIRITQENLDSAIASYQGDISLTLDDEELSALLGLPSDQVAFNYPVTSIRDLAPDNLIKNEPHLNEVAQLIDDISSLLQLSGEQLYLNVEDYPKLRLRPFENNKVARQDLEVLKVSLEDMLCRTIDHILHQPEWQRVESSWRSVLYLLQGADGEKNIELDVLTCNRDLLWDDLVRNADVYESDLYHLLYQRQSGQFGAAPYAVILLDEYFDATGQDCQILSKLGQLGMALHAPVVSAAKPEILGTQHFSNLMSAKDLPDLFTTLRYLKFRNLLASVESRYLILTLPRIKARDRYSPASSKLKWYKERPRSGIDTTLYINSAFAFVLNLVRSFSQHNLCTEIIGPEKGQVQAPSCEDVVDALPVEIIFSELMENTLTNLGLTPLCTLKSSNTMYFQSANSLHWGHYYISKEKMTSDVVMSCNLSFLTIALRFAHNIKARFREQLGHQRAAKDIQSGLDRWLQQYVSDVESPGLGILAKRPLKQASIQIMEAGTPGWFNIDLTLIPHYSKLNKKASIDLNLMINSSL
jgi:type VI secretion system protein ImpC